MMEIAFGPDILMCAVRGALFGLVAALIVPMTFRRFGGLAGRVGLAALSGGLFAALNLAVTCAHDGAPPRIVIVAGLAMLASAAAGALLLSRPLSSTRSVMSIESPRSLNE